MLGEQLCDFAAAASVFAFNGDDFDHGLTLLADPVDSDPLDSDIHFYCTTSLTPPWPPAAAGIVLLQKKSQKEHDPCAHGENLEGVDVGQAGGLGLQALVNAGIGGDLRFVLANAGGRQLLGQAVR